MCTYVETPDVKILFDAGVSLCPKRFGLLPHPKEFKAISESRKKMAEAAEKAEIVTLSHYHFDHHTPSFEDCLCNWTAEGLTARQIYEGKVVLVKDPKQHINASQRMRGWMFQKTAGKYAKTLKIADGATFKHGNTFIRFSKPVFHGSENSPLGWTLMTAIECGEEKLMFAPDVQGPISANTLDMILSETPQVIILGGPPLYLTGFKVDEKEAAVALRNLQTVVKHVPMTILEHHILRDDKWKEKATKVFQEADEIGHRILTAAEFCGCQNTLLEAERKKLFIENPPSKDFEKWMKNSDEKQRHVKPPCE